MNNNEDNTEAKATVVEKYRFRITTLLMIIGLWLALPATCGLLQRIIDNLTSFEIVQKNTALIIKLSADICLGIFYIIGLFALLVVGISGYGISVVKDNTLDVVMPKVKKPFKNGVQRVNEEFRYHSPAITNRIKGWSIAGWTSLYDHVRKSSTSYKDRK